MLDYKLASPRGDPVERNQNRNNSQNLKYSQKLLQVK
jgi:hypothetical protein